MIQLGKEEREQQKTKDAAQKELIANLSFYQKLANGLDVNILIVGDSIGNGTGASNTDHAWTSLIPHIFVITIVVKLHLLISLWVGM